MSNAEIYEVENKVSSVARWIGRALAVALFVLAAWWIGGGV
jgi:hypothetical protein